MGIPPEVAHGAIRLSLSRDTSRAEIDLGIREIVAAVRRLRPEATPVLQPID
jgi:cysteine sulfinate desulfinase/cysteine desulfurase-like protein